MDMETSKKISKIKAEIATIDEQKKKSEVDILKKQSLEVELDIISKRLGIPKSELLKEANIKYIE